MKAGIIATLFASIILLISSCKSIDRLYPLDISSDSFEKERLTSSNEGKVAYAPMLAADGKTLFFTSNRDGSIYNYDHKVFSHDIWISDFDHKTMSISDIRNANNIYQGINSSMNEGSTFIHDFEIPGFFLYSTNIPSCLQIMRVNFKNDSAISNTFISDDFGDEYFDSSPTYSKGSLIYTSHEPIPPKTKDNYDFAELHLWQCDYDTLSNIRGEPEPIKELISSGTEHSPYLTRDGKRLYFASTGFEPNYGGYDLYYSDWDSTAGKWSTPVNLGKNINSEDNELYIYFNKDKSLVFWSSDREGAYNIYVGYMEEE